MSDLKTTWTINGLLLVILTLLIAQFAHRGVGSAAAAGGGWETDGVMVTITPTTQDRVILIDTKNQNIVMYRPRNGGGFGLVGARSYKYDVEIEDSEGKIKNNGWTYADTKLEYDKKNAAK
jgi:hypothetical protein